MLVPLSDGGLGKGIYFKKNWYDAADNKISPPDGSNSHKRIYQCQVLTGNVTTLPKGSDCKDLFEAPMMPSFPTMRYDAVVDSEQNPETFVIFRDVQAYPQYLITFI